MKILLEGWRGIGQSLAIVNQFQALALLRRGDVSLLHNDLPTPLNWDPARNGAGFSPNQADQIAAIAGYAGEPVDAVYRIVAPTRSGAPDDRRRTVTFKVTEMGVDSKCMPAGTDMGFLTRDENIVVTPTQWSADRLVEAGFPADRVRIIPHGVDRSLFFPLPADERASLRARFGVADDETVLLNIGGPFWNKGPDLLLEAFAILRARGRRVRLALKDQSSLYGLGMKGSIAQIGARRPELLTPASLAAISLFPGNFNFAQLRELFALADFYVSPYRAEGFNLPVLEAIACDVPVIVTAGGATDDFCPEPLATRVSGKAGALPGEPGFPAPRFVEPDLDDLVETLDRACRFGAARPKGWETARESVLSEFSWDRAAALLLDCAGLKGAAPAPAPSARPLPLAQEPPSAKRFGAAERDALSILIPTMNSEAYISLIADYYDNLGLDPYYFVDDKTSDRTFELLTARSRRVAYMHNEAAIIEAKIEDISRAAPTNWVLRIDDDELPSLAMLNFAFEIIKDDRFDVLGFLRHQCGVTGEGALAAHRGHDPKIHRQFRLYRRDRVKYRKDVHTPGFHFEDVRIALAFDDCFLVHLDWAVRSYSDRQMKIVNYNNVEQNAGDVWRSYYLPEEAASDPSVFERLENAEFKPVAAALALRFPDNTIEAQSKRRKLLLDPFPQTGLYKMTSVTEFGASVGVVVLQDGKMHGGDSSVAYVGSYKQEGGRLTASITMREHTRVPGVFDVFGARHDRETQVNLAGTVAGSEARMTGVARSAPDVPLEVTLTLLDA